MAAWECGRWRIELIGLDDGPAFRVTVGGRLASAVGRYPRTTQELEALLRRVAAPALAEFLEVDR